MTANPAVDIMPFLNSKIRQKDQNFKVKFWTGFL